MGAREVRMWTQGVTVHYALIEISRLEPEPPTLVLKHTAWNEWTRDDRELISSEHVLFDDLAEAQAALAAL